MMGWLPYVSADAWESEPDTVDRPRHALVEPGDRTSHRVGLVCACGGWSSRTSDADARAAWKTHADERTAA